MGLNASANITTAGVFGTGCSTETLVSVGVGGAACVMGAAGLYCLGSFAKRKIVGLVHNGNHFMQGYQLRNDAVLAINLLAVVGGVLVGSTIGLGYPSYAPLTIAGVTTLANCAICRYLASTRPLEPAEAEPVVIQPTSSLHLDADSCLFSVNPNKISVHSVGAALELMKTMLQYRTDHRRYLENMTAQQIRDYYADPAHPLPIAHTLSIDFGGNAKNLLDQKYGIGVTAANLTQHQLKNRHDLLESVGADEDRPRAIRHPAIPGVPLSETQITGWLMDIRQQLSTENSS